MPSHSYDYDPVATMFSWTSVFIPEVMAPYSSLLAPRYLPMQAMIDAAAYVPPPPSEEKIKRIEKL